MASLYFKFNADFDNVARLKQEIDKLTAEIRKLDGATQGDQIERYQKTLSLLNAEFKHSVQEASKAGEEYDKTSQAINTMNGISTKFIATLGGLSMLKNLAGSIVQVRGEFQQLEIAFGTMLQSSEKANVLMKELTQTAAHTPFDLQGIAGAAKQMLAYGSSAEKVNGELIMLGNVAAGVGSSIGDIAYLYGTLRTQGRAYLMDIRQFAGRGIPIYEELSKQLGVSRDEVNKLVSAGKVGFPEIEKCFQSMTAEGGKFYNLMAEQSKSLTGQISNLQDAWDMMLNEMGQNTEGIANTTLNIMSSLVENYDKVLKAIVSLVTVYGILKTALVINTVLYGKQIVISQSLRKEMIKLASQGVILSKNEKMLAVWTNGLSLKFKELWVTLSANPLGLILSAFTLVAGAIWTFSGDTDEATKAVTDFEDRTDKQIGKLDMLQSTLENTDKTSNTYKNTVDEVNKMCKEYGVTLLNENATLDEQKRKYEELKGAIKAANAEKTASSLRENASSKLAEENNKSIEDYIKKLKSASTTTTNMQGDVFDVAEFRVRKNAQEIGSMIGSEIQNAIVSNFGKGDDVINAELEKVKKNTEKALRSAGYSEDAIQSVLYYDNAFNKLTESVKGNIEANKESLKLAESYERANQKDIQAMHDRQKATKLSTMSSKQLNEELERMKTEFNKIGVHIVIKADVQISDSYKKQYNDLSKANLANNVVAIQNAINKVANSKKLDKMTVKLNNGRIDTKGTKEQMMQQLTNELQMQQMLLGEKTDKETNAGDSYKKALSKYRSSKKEYDKALADVKKGATKLTDSDLKELKEKYTTAEKNLKEYGGDPDTKKGGKSAGKGSAFDVKQAQYDINKISESFNKSISDYNEKAKQALAEGRLNAMKEGTSKDIAQIKAQNEQEMKAYDEEINKFIEQMKKNDLDKWLKGGKNRKAYDYTSSKTDDEYKKELFAQSPELETNYIALRAQSQAKLNKALNQIQEEQLKADYDYLIQYGEIADKRVALEKKYNIELSQARSERERKILKKEYDKSLNSLKLETLKSDDSYIEAFEDLGQVSNETLTRLIKMFEEAKDSQKDLSPTELKEYVDTIRQMRDELDARNPFTALKESIKEATQARKEYEDYNKQYTQTGTITTGRMVIQKGTDLEGNETEEAVLEILKGEEAIKFLEKAQNKFIKSTAKVKKGIQANATAFSKLFSAMQDAGSALGDLSGDIVTTIAGIGSLVTNTITSFSTVSASASQAVQTIEKASIILTAISVAFQLTQKIIGMFDDAKQKKIEKIQDKIDSLSKSYDKLENSISKAYSKEAVSLIKQEEINLKQQRVLIEQQKQIEESKKKTDKSKISDYNDKIDEIEEKLEELKDQEIDVIFGQDIQSAISSFADAYISAWEQGENRIRSSKNFVKDMIKSMITEAMKSDLTKPMEKIRTMLQGYFSDNIITTAEEAEVAAYAEQVTKELEEKYAWANKYLKDNNDTSESQGMASMSESTAEELNGRFTALQISGEKISAENIVQTKTLSLLNLKADDITKILASQKDISDEMRTQLANIYIELKGINDNTLAVVKPIANMSKKMDKWDNKIMNL